ncbi:MAG: adenine deaminase [Bacteroidota bacterium]
MSTFTISGQLIDLFQRRTYPATISVIDGIIRNIKEVPKAPDQYILPGFIDAHVHIESSMLVPTAFARIAVVHGTVATVSDPHEIANVCGIEGVEYMINNSKKTPFKFFFGAPSCVPATSFETAGAVLDSAAVEKMLQSPDIWYLTEMMNYPGVLHNDPEVLAKIKAAQKADKPIDGHAPGLKGDEASQYAAAGITTDHECFTMEEALDKIKSGMKILIREGSAAKNYEALCDLLRTQPTKVMFCSDDKHPDELVLYHINDLVKRSLAKGYTPYDILWAACVSPVLHYKLPVGMLRENDPADFIVINKLQPFDILQTYIDGRLVAEKGKTLLPYVRVEPINNFNCQLKSPKDFVLNVRSDAPLIRVMEAIEGQLVTNELILQGKNENGCWVSDIEQDILKIVVVNRYNNNAPISVGFIKNIGLKKGAIASTVAHDCHNIIAVGVDDDTICAAVNALISCKGGISVAAHADTVDCMPLPIAGLMTGEDGYEVAAKYSLIDKKAKELGTPLHAPYMTLSFMALLVIPSLKLSDMGLFDGRKFQFTSVEA